MWTATLVLMLCGNAMLEEEQGRTDNEEKTVSLYWKQSHLFSWYAGIVSAYVRGRGLLLSRGIYAGTALCDLWIAPDEGNRAPLCLTVRVFRCSDNAASSTFPTAVNRWNDIVREWNHKTGKTVWSESGPNFTVGREASARASVRN